MNSGLHLQQYSSRDRSRVTSIKKYCSSTWSMDGADSNGSPVHKNGSSSKIITAEWCKELIDKKLHYCIMKNTFRVTVIFLEVEKIEWEKFALVHLLCFFLFFSVMHNLQLMNVLHANWLVALLLERVLFWFETMFELRLASCSTKHTPWLVTFYYTTSCIFQVYRNGKFLRSTNFHSFRGSGWTVKLKFVKLNLHVKFLACGTQLARLSWSTLRPSVGCTS